MTTIYGDQDSSNLNDELYGTSDADTIYGGAGNDFLISAGNDGSGPDVLVGGIGNDAMMGSDQDTRFEFDIGFGKDIVGLGKSGDQVLQFNFAQPDTLLFHRYKYQLIVQVGDDWVTIVDYFDKNRDSNATISLNFTDQSFSQADVANLVLQGTVNDDWIYVDGREYEQSGLTPAVTMTGGGGDDYLEFGQPIPATTAVPDVQIRAVFDGGAGDDIIQSSAVQNEVLFGRDSGHDILLIATRAGRSVQITLDADIQAGDVSFHIDASGAYLAIQGSDARLYVEAFSARNLDSSMASLNDWQVNIGGSNVSLNSLIMASPEIADGLYVIATDLSYDGEQNSGNETVYLPNQNTVYTSGSDNETFLSAYNVSPTLKFNSGFGQDTLYGGATIEFDQEQSSYVFGRRGEAFTITDTVTGDTLTIGEFKPMDTTVRFQFGSILMTSRQLLNSLEHNPVDGAYYLMDQVQDRQPNNTPETSEAYYYTDFAWSSTYISVNGGANINNFYLGNKTTVTHDTSYAGTDHLIWDYSFDSMYNQSSVKIITTDASQLKAYMDADGMVRITDQTGSSIDGFIPIFKGSSFNRPTFMGIDVFEQDAEGNLTSVSFDLMERIHQTSLDEGGPVHLFLQQNSIVGVDGAPQQAGAGEIIDGMGTIYGTWVSVDGLGGNDTFRGGGASETFIVSSLNSGENVLVQAGKDNVLATLGTDTVDISALGLNSAAMSTALVRSDNDLLINVNGGQVRIDDFFQPSVISAFQKLQDFSLLEGGTLSDEMYQLFMLGFAPAQDGYVPGNISHVIDYLKFTDRTVSYAEIAALFPAHNNNPTDGDDIIYGDQDPASYADTIDALGGNDIVYGLTDSDVLVGGSGNDQLYGADGDDMLDGGTGVDTLVGGVGDDEYYVDDSADVIVEQAGEGHDSVHASVSYVLSANVEDLFLDGSASINGTGNAENNVLLGNSGKNVLDGGLGQDAMIGGSGNDTYLVDDTLDGVSESANAGIDIVLASASYTLGANIENLTLQGAVNLNGVGNTLNNVLVGNSANNSLSGDAGNDTLNGGAGDDSLNGGTGNDSLLGGTGNDSLNGGSSGNDTLIGGAGNDSYSVNGGDSVSENAGEGVDLVLSTISYTLGVNVENLTLQGVTAINGTGNTLDNVLTGNTGNNILIGDAGNDSLNGGSSGNDTLIGGAGNDTYTVNGGDSVSENAGEGVDLVLSTISYTLGVNVENLTLQGTTAINGTGNTLDNMLTGNTGNNILIGDAGNDSLNGGSSGNDTLIGGAGNDTYTVNGGDSVSENAGEGVDLVLSTISYTLGVNVENLTLQGTTAINGTGNTLDNMLTGNTGNNILTGDLGNDTVNGGSGNDTLNGGVGNDSLLGSVGNDTLNGDAGVDTLLGGAGNDTYIVGDTDTITELANEGTDTVLSGVTHTLGANIENLTLQGVAAIDGIGNTLANVMVGNSAANTLNGGAGNDSLAGNGGNDSLLGGTGLDTLDGGTGNDLLNGGSSNDTYLFNRTYGLDTILDSDSTAANKDVLQFGGDVANDQLWFSRNGNDLDIQIIGTNDHVSISNWFGGKQYHVEEIRAGNAKILTDANVQNLVNAMASMTPPPTGQTTLTTAEHNALDPVIIASWS